MSGPCWETVKVKFVRRGCVYVMSPWSPTCAAELTYTLRDFDREAGRYQFVRKELFTLTRPSPGLVCAVIMEGFLGRVVRHMTRLGVRPGNIEVTDDRDMRAVAPVPDLGRLTGELRPGQLEVLHAVARSPRGIVARVTGEGKSYLIVQICLMYPTLRIVIVSRRQQVVSTLHNRLKAVLPPGEVGISSGDFRAGLGHRVVVSTVLGVQKLDMMKCDLFMFDEAHAVGHNNTAVLMTQITRPRKFGFTATPKGRGDGADLVMEGVFGPVIAEDSYEEAVRRGNVTPIEVWMLQVPCGPDLERCKAAVERKRMGYWRNTPRNATIASAARRFPEDEQVLIMVETLEHAINLHKMLPEYRVVHFGSLRGSARRVKSREEYELSPAAKESIRKDFESGVLKKVISTMTWKEGVDFPKLAVLIRADGLSGYIDSTQVPGRLSRLSEGKSKGVVIDFDDTFSKWSMTRSQERVSSYNEHRWPVCRISL